ncbi:DNA-3-methyladenine glycosylase 2 family protein [Streptomyces sp. NPDC049954]|uniref:DNA-3-methyladenine glycosylase family protein n=1 Tax=Streptomyces sp. NPDC049954 TaxID=3155779 RepID=UPI0034291AF4
MPELHPLGAFDLRRSLAFLEGWPPTAGEHGDTSLDFTYCTPGDWAPTTVRVTQKDRTLRVEASRTVTDELLADVARILSVDVDATPLSRIAATDPVVAARLKAAPGLRPVLFWSTWEAVCWSVLSHRTSVRAASTVSRRVRRETGPRVTWQGEERAAFPPPHQVIDAPALPGVEPPRLARLQALAEAALDGTLDAAALRALPTEKAVERLGQLPGVGPFYAGLILVRGAGAPDVLPASEPRLKERMRRAYGLAKNAPDERYREIGEQWRPLRSWCAFLLRAAPESDLRPKA